MASPTGLELANTLGWCGRHHSSLWRGKLVPPEMGWGKGPSLSPVGGGVKGAWVCLVGKGHGLALTWFGGGGGGQKGA